MKCVLASGNQGKIKEFSSLLDDEFISIVSPNEKLEVVESGSSFEENALLKAKTYFEKFNTPSLSDDSGIIVESLPDELGVKSARFGKANFNDEERAKHLLKKLENQENRNAYFVCVLCLFLSPENIMFFEGRMKGFISNEYVSGDGFGYDPVFIPEEFSDKKITIAQKPDWKRVNSHRARACQELIRFLKSSSSQA